MNRKPLVPRPVIPILASGLLFILAAFPAAGQDSGGGLEDLSRARILIWSGTGSDVEIDRLLDSAERYFSSMPESAEQSYLLARTALNRGRAANARGSRSEAREYFEEAMAFAESSVLETRSSDALRVMADAGTEWMVSKGLVGIIRMAPRVQDWVDGALLLDPGNVLGVIIKAGGQVNAPRSAGGDPEAAVLALEALLVAGIGDEVTLFRARQALASAYKKTKQRDLVAEQCRLAAEIFPDSPLADCP